MFYTYVLRSKKDNKFYTGTTSDLRERFKLHSEGEVFSTKGREPLELIYYEACNNSKDAFARERYLKSGAGKRYIKNRLKRSLSLTGFTLIEILVAIFIFGLAFTATTSVLIMNNRSAAIIRNNFIASGLAQEGIEVARNIRDRDWFLDNPLGANPFGTSIPDGIYRAQWDSSALIALGGNPNLKRDAGTGIFSYDLGNDTIFKRTIEISTPVANVEKKIVVNVTWIERGGASKLLSAEEHLFNWR